MKRQRAASASWEEEMALLSIFPSDAVSFEDLLASEPEPSLTCKTNGAFVLFCFFFLVFHAATQCLFLAARGKSGGIRASKGLSERATLPPGHILNYPTRWESHNPCIHKHTHAGNNKRNYLSSVHLLRFYAAV